MTPQKEKPTYETMQDVWPEVYEQLLCIGEHLEEHFKDVCDIEFTVENGKLFVLNVRRARRTPQANLQFAIQFYQEGKIQLSEAIDRVRPEDIEILVRPAINNRSTLTHLGNGLPASPGAATGKLILFRDKAEKEGRRNDVIFARNEMSPEDVGAMSLASGILTTRGGMTSHAAVVCRGLKRPCVSGFGGMDIHYSLKQISFPGKRVCQQGDWITICGSTGEVFLGKGLLQAPRWQNIPELCILAQMIEYAIVTSNANLSSIGLTWRIRDYFVHSVPLRNMKSNKRAIHRDTYTSFSPPARSSLRNAHRVLCKIEPEQCENYSQIILGLCRTFLRLLASHVGIGNHHKYFRSLWDPKAGISNVEKQFLGFEFFRINYYIPHLPDISNIVFLLEVQIDSENDKWFLDFTNPDGESLIPNSDHLLSCRLYVNGAQVNHGDLPDFYNLVRKREYYWQWYTYNKTSHTELVEFLRTKKFASSPDSRLVIYCEELGLIRHGNLTAVGHSMIGREDKEHEYGFFTT